MTEHTLFKLAAPSIFRAERPDAEQLLDELHRTISEIVELRANGAATADKTQQKARRLGYSLRESHGGDLDDMLADARRMLTDEYLRKLFARARITDPGEKQLISIAIHACGGSEAPRKAKAALDSICEGTDVVVTRSLSWNVREILTIIDAPQPAPVAEAKNPADSGEARPRPDISRSRRRKGPTTQAVASHVATSRELQAEIREKQERRAEEAIGELKAILAGTRNSTRTLRDSFEVARGADRLGNIEFDYLVAEEELATAVSDLRAAFTNASAAYEALSVEDPADEVHLRTSDMLDKESLPKVPEYKFRTLDRKGHPPAEVDMSDLKGYRKIDDPRVQKLLEQIQVARGANAKAQAKLDAANDRNTELARPVDAFRREVIGTYQEQAQLETAHAANLWIEVGRAHNRETSARNAEALRALVAESPELLEQIPGLAARLG